MVESRKGREQRVLVIGAGVSGLTSALCLSARGFGVTVVAKEFAPRVTSVVAGALWEWPPGVCGYHQDQASLARSKAWSAESYERFAELANEPGTGVFMRPATFYFKHLVRDNPKSLEKMEELRSKVLGFAHDATLIEANGVNRSIGLRDAYTHIAPMIDTDDYLKWLTDQVASAGCRIVHQTITGNLRGQGPTLLDRYGADVIVNCSGLGSRELAADSMYPLRGALIRVRNDGRAMPIVSQAHCVSHDPSSSVQDIVFIVPRGRAWIVLGGLVEPDEWDTEIGLDNHPPVRKMLERCIEFLPALRNAEIDRAEPVRVGLRPFRRQNVRLEAEPDARIIHNYGHGGAGVTFSWGCAREVADQVEWLVRGMAKPR
jgi:D-amino-acid oxidase